MVADPLELLPPDVRELLAAEPAEPGLADLGALLDELESFVRRFVWFPDEHCIVPVVLFVPVCYALLADPGSVPVAPYIHITSPAPECGKSRLVEVVHKLLGDERALFVGGSMTPATLFRSREQGPITFLIDEAGRLFGRRDDVASEVIAILDAGYRRGATVPRAVPVGKTFEVRRWAVFGPAVFSGLGTLADTTRSRTIPILLQRRPPSARVERFFEADVEPVARAIRERLEATAPALAAALRDHRPDLDRLGGLRDRTLEVWWGPLGVAELAGGGWAQRARAAALALHGASPLGAEPDRQALLLGALKEVFDEAGVDRLATMEILTRLVEREGEPWPAWWGSEVEQARDRGRPARRAASELASKLKAFGVSPRAIRLPDGTTPRGYLKEDFGPAWATYLRGGNATDATDATPLASTVASVASVASGAGAETEQEGDVSPDELEGEEREALERAMTTLGATPLPPPDEEVQL